MHFSCYWCSLNSIYKIVHSFSRRIRAILCLPSAAQKISPSPQKNFLRPSFLRARRESFPISCGGTAAPRAADCSSRAKKMSRPVRGFCRISAHEKSRLPKETARMALLTVWRGVLLPSVPQRICPSCPVRCSRSRCRRKRPPPPRGTSWRTRSPARGCPGGRARSRCPDRAGRSRSTGGSPRGSGRCTGASGCGRW